MKKYEVIILLFIACLVCSSCEQVKIANVDFNCSQDTVLALVSNNKTPDAIRIEIIEACCQGVYVTLSDKRLEEVPAKDLINKAKNSNASKEGLSKQEMLFLDFYTDSISVIITNESKTECKKRGKLKIWY
jgi:hypothetical protein